VLKIQLLNAELTSFAGQMRPKVHRMSLVVLPYRSHPQLPNLEAPPTRLRWRLAADRMTLRLPTARISLVVICFPCRSFGLCGLSSKSKRDLMPFGALMQLAKQRTMQCSLTCLLALPPKYIDQLESHQKLLTEICTVMRPEAQLGPTGKTELGDSCFVLPIGFLIGCTSVKS
jgi:hypothetical protein